jgi:hypothetical protein
MSTLPKRLQVMRRLCDAYCAKARFTTTNEAVTIHFTNPWDSDNFLHDYALGKRGPFDVRLSMREFDNLF